MATSLNVIRADLLGTCPLPKFQYDQILLGHGSGGQMTADLIRRLFLPAFDSPVLAAQEDQATVRIQGEPASGQGSPCLHDRRLRRATNLLSGRRYRQVSRPWHGQ